MEYKIVEVPTLQEDGSIYTQYEVWENNLYIAWYETKEEAEDIIKELKEN